MTLNCSFQPSFGVKITFNSISNHNIYLSLFLYVILTMATKANALTSLVMVNKLQNAVRMFTVPETGVEGLSIRAASFGEMGLTINIFCGSRVRNSYRDGIYQLKNHFQTLVCKYKGNRGHNLVPGGSQTLNFPQHLPF